MTSHWEPRSCGSIARTDSRHSMAHGIALACWLRGDTSAAEARGSDGEYEDFMTGFVTPEGNPWGATCWCYRAKEAR